MNGLDGAFHKIVAAVWLEIPVIDLPDDAWECGVELPKHHAAGFVEFVTRRLEDAAIAVCIEQLHLVGEVPHVHRRSIPIEHGFVIRIVVTVAGAGVVIAPGIVERIREIVVRNKIRNDLRQRVVRRLGRNAGLILTNPVFFSILSLGEGEFD